MKHSLEMDEDGDICVYQHQGDLKVRVMHLSYNPGDSLFKNLLYAWFMMYGFEKGYGFEEAKKFAHTSLRLFLGDFGA